jgi:hypothetical protein
VTQEAQVDIGLAEKQVRLIQMEKTRFFDTLRKKQAVWNQ